MAHTPGPWHYGAYLGGSYAVDKVGPQGDREAHIADCHGLNALYNARRIAVAVNACQGIPTEALEDGVLQEMRDALQAMLDAFVWAQDAPPLKNPDGSRTGWQFVATRTLERVRELLRRSGDPVPDRALARFLGDEAPS